MIHRILAILALCLTQAAEAVPPRADGLMAGAQDLADKRIAVLQGAASEPWATATYPQAKILQFTSPADTLLAVRTGKVDLTLFDGFPARELVRQDPAFALLGVPLQRLPLGVGFNKQSHELREQFNAFLSKLERTGILEEMVGRWVEEGSDVMPASWAQSPRGRRPGVAPLRVGISTGTLPFEAVKDGRLIGFDIELMHRFAADLGREVRFDRYEFGGLVAAVASGKADLIISSIFITEERKKAIDFSNPYLEESTQALVLRSRLAPEAPGAAFGAPTPRSGEPVAEPRGQGLWSDFKQGVERNLIAERRYLLLWEGLQATVIIALASTALGTALAALLCAMRMSQALWLQWPARVYIGLMRGLPVLVLLMMIFYVVLARTSTDGLVVAIIAFALNFAAYAAEIFRAGIASIDPGQREGALAIGFNRLQAFLHITLPQTVQRILPVYKGEFISLVKMTSIVGYIAVEDLAKAGDIIRSRTFDAFFPLLVVAALYLLIGWMLLTVLQALERRLDPFERRRRREARGQSHALHLDAVGRT